VSDWESRASSLRFFWTRKLWWMTSMIVVPLVFGIMLVFGQSSAIAPLIDTMF